MLPPALLKWMAPFGPKANCTLDLCPVEMTVYGYRPSLAANITFLCLYLLSAAIHIYLGVRRKTWFFMGCMVVGACNAVTGYAARIALYHNPFNFTAFIIQIICITSGPVYYSAAIYVTLADAIRYFSRSASHLPPYLFYWIFITCDVVCLLFQAAGGALSTVSAAAIGSSAMSKVGVDMALAGLSMQVAVMVIFCGLFADYLIRYFREGATDRFGRRAQLFFGFMALAVLLILTRCAYRLVELRNGYMGALIREEGLFIGLEGVMVISAVFCLMIAHPGFLFKNDDKRSSVGGSVAESYVLRDLA
ncbi:hypothetical protein PG994_001486 [Apiospora phragmitis]|uniref:Parasitic phase-specific protein PSP-1 n=1 Tax=Apiospora phragmitis TaxID=2905665 RepID=A0ABR1WTM3_9PEZI